MAPSVPVKLAAADELSKSDLEHTVLYPGFLLDYYTGPSIKSYMSPLVVVIDMGHNVAVIPGSGNVPVVFTYSLDIGRYVDAALDLKGWDPSYTIIGNKITLNDFVQAAQDAKARSDSKQRDISDFWSPAHQYAGIVSYQ
ncbi:Oxidoreductase BOA1 [Colletotrichum tropicale]|nr:Oxidoreductase BOA1 [Colletotrichum tropicale]